MGRRPSPKGHALHRAASEFFRDGAYDVAGQRLSTDELVAMYEDLVADFPIWSIEDGLAEDDWAGWRTMTDRRGENVQLVGDDIFVTNPQTIAEAARRGVANAALIKLNQIGTVTETLGLWRPVGTPDTGRWSRTAPVRQRTRS